MIRFNQDFLSKLQTSNVKEGTLLCLQWLREKSILLDVSTTMDSSFGILCTTYSEESGYALGLRNISNLSLIMEFFDPWKQIDALAFKHLYFQLPLWVQGILLDSLKLCGEESITRQVACQVRGERLQACLDLAKMLLAEGWQPEIFS